MRFRTGHVVAFSLVLAAACNRPAELSLDTRTESTSVLTTTAPVPDTVAREPQPSVSSHNQPETSGWPNLFGPHHNSHSTETAARVTWPPTGPTVPWRVPVGTGYSSPITDGAHVFVSHRIGDREIVECFAAETGGSLWKSDFPTTFVCKVAYSDGPYSTPVLRDGRLFVMGAQGQLRCLGAADGRLIWERLLQPEYGLTDGTFPISTSPFPHGELLIVNVGGKQAGIVAFKQATGEPVWSATSDAASCATPVAAEIHGREHLFVFTYEGLTFLTPGAGDVLWKFPYRPKNPETIIATSPVVHGELVIASGYQLGTLCVRVREDGHFEQQWHEPRALDSQYNNLICHDGLLFGFSAIDKTLRCVDVATGKLHWKWRSKLGRGNMIVVNGHLLIVGQAGHFGSLRINVRKPECVALTSAPLLEGPVYAAPALCQGRLYLRNEMELVCVDLREEDRVAGAWR
jgi:outer membrane protein assembly factor BamB